MYTTDAQISVDSLLLYDAGGNTVSAFLSETAYIGAPIKVGTLKVDDVIKRSDYAGGAAGDEAYAKDKETFNKEHPNGIDVTRAPGLFKSRQ